MDFEKTYGTWGDLRAEYPSYPLGSGGQTILDGTGTEPFAKVMLGLALMETQKYTNGRIRTADTCLLMSIQTWLSIAATKEIQHYLSNTPAGLSSIVYGMHTACLGNLAHGTIIVGRFVPDGKGTSAWMIANVFDPNQSVPHAKNAAQALVGMHAQPPGTAKPNLVSFTPSQWALLPTNCGLDADMPKKIKFREFL